MSPMQETIVDRFLHSRRAGWVVLRCALIVGPILVAMVIAVALFVEAWRH
jgi:hypothetical protein